MPDHRSPIRVEQIGEGVTYADGAEDELLAIVAGATDRRAVSDELAGHIRDWPTRYHLSRLRSNLLTPLRIGPGVRVLDVGAGTGVIARTLAERGASVIALEGNADRAAVAAARCDGAGDVRILAGSVHELGGGEGPFDLALSVGVLEYAGAPHGGGEGPEAFLARLASAIGPDGAVVVAIENQFGLKYLLGHDEDHLARPMIGIEGYPGAASVRTWSRRRLGELLASVGLTATRWLFPFPDYKLPTAILAEAAYAEPDLVDQLLRWPVRDHLESRTFPVDHRSAHAQFVEAGLGPDVSNSFLVVAARDDEVLDRLVDPDVVAWMPGGDRRRPWRRGRTVSARTGGLAVRLDERADGVLDSWLGRRDPAEREWRAGRTVEGRVLDAWALDDDAVAAAAIAEWAAWLDRRQLDDPVRTDWPYAPRGAALDPSLLDVSLANFVTTADGLAYVDDEWQLEGGVDRDLAVYRALWYFARDAVHGAAHRPAPIRRATVDELAASLVAPLAIDVAPTHERFLHDEALLQAEVSGGDTTLHRAALVAQGASAGPDRGARVVGAVGEHLVALQAERDRLAAHVTAAEDELAAWRARWDRIERLPPVRLLRALRDRR